MIKFEQALSLTLSESIPVTTERVPLAEASGRFLAVPVDSPIDAPPFDKAAMDGYAVGAEDVRDSYHLRETVAAGDVPSPEFLAAGEATKIMTGAPLPPGAGRVIRVEFTRLEGETVVVTEPEPYPNVILKGENIVAGDRLLERGRLGPKEVGCLAAAGFAEVEVCRLLRIGVIATGDELRRAGTPLEPGEIYDSNSPQLSAQIENAGCIPLLYGIVPDNRDSHLEAVRKGLSECDILLLSGGVSMGDFDYVPEVLREARVEIKYHRIRVKPGRPTLFGRTEKTLVFGLPGNPVSAFVIFEVLVRPLVHRLQNAPSPGITVSGRLDGAIKRKDTERAEFYPAVTRHNRDGVFLTPVRYGGSSHLNALAGAQALITIAAGTGDLKDGSQVDARLI